MISITSCITQSMSADEQARIKKAQQRLFIAGLATLTVYDSHLLPISETEKINDLLIALAFKLIEEEPAFLFTDLETLTAAFQMAIYMGLILGSQYDFPAAQVAMVQAEREEQQAQS